jgi:hypothetical protein
MSPLAEKKYEVKCILSGRYLPGQGSENWQIFRNENASTLHTLLYKTVSSCENSASLTLQDGRVMVFDQ